MIRTLRALLATMRFEASIPFLVPDVVRDYSDLHKHVDWRNYMTAEDIETAERTSGPNIGDILGKIARKLAEENNIPVPDDFAHTAPDPDSADQTQSEPVASPAQSAPTPIPAFESADEPAPAQHQETRRDLVS